MHGPFRIFEDCSGSAIEIQGAANLTGNLGIDRESGVYNQVRQLRSSDPLMKKGLIKLWDAFLKAPESSIFPKMLAVTEFDGNPTYISSLPLGEAIPGFIEEMAICLLKWLLASFLNLFQRSEVILLE